MTQNIYDNETFFQQYAQLKRSTHGLSGAPEWTSIVKILPDLKGLNIVDLGCGYGWFCRYAQEKDAKHVLGLDISERMLSKAKQMSADNTIVYRQQNLEQLELPQDTYDLAYSSLTLHYIESLSQLFKTIYQSLRSGGYFIFSSEHPIYTAPREPAWSIDEDSKRSWPINNYQTEGRRVTDWLVKDVVKQHRTMGTYLNMLIEQGFIIRHVEEWGPTPQQIIENPSLDEEKERPMILLVSVQKPHQK